MYTRCGVSDYEERRGNGPVNYWIHKVRSTEENPSISYGLLDRGWTNTGWQCLVEEGPLDNPVNEAIKRGNRNNGPSFRRYKQEAAVGDIFVTPLINSQDIGFFELLGDAVPVTELPVEVVESLPGDIHLDDAGIYDIASDGKRHTYDVGFVRPVKRLKVMRRTILPPELKKNLRYRGTTCHADGNAVREALSMEAPVPISDYLRQGLVPEVLGILHKRIDPNQLEDLVKWVAEEKLGANRAWKPAKNESGKRDGADADVVAEFDDLNLRVYIQAKCHEGQTGSWGVEQVSRYAAQRAEANPDDEMATEAWLVSTADFPDEVVELAERETPRVRLIGGADLADILLRHGFSGIDDAVPVR